MTIQIVVTPPHRETGQCILTVLNQLGLPIGRGVVTHVVRIASTPPGEAPKWVRDAWIGLEFPALDPEVTTNPDKPPSGVLSGRPSSDVGYTVPAAVAFDLLRRKAPDAFDWWQTHTQVTEAVDVGLCFDNSACVVVATGSAVYDALQRVYPGQATVH